MPDLVTLCRVCEWLEVSPARFFQGASQIADIALPPSIPFLRARASAIFISTSGSS